MVILLLSNKWDISTDYIVENLRKRDCKFLRINSEDLINSSSLVSFHPFCFWIKDKKINLTKNLRSVFLRRPGKPFEFIETDKPSSSTLRYVTDQWHSFISGLESIPNVLWINDPHKNSFAEMKINQLAYAEKIGFRIPKTCMTNSKKELFEFAESCDNKIIAKALYSPLIQDNEKEFFVFSNRLSDFSSIDEKEFSLAPTIFQEEIQNKIDYRITIVGSSCFSAEIIYKDKSILDWRKIKDEIQIKPCSLPSDITEQCIRYVSKLGLVFGAIDLVKSKDDYYFLEINPNGEWGWLQKNPGLPIAESISNQLVRGEENK